jgi:ribose 5-phosphate isomerase B
MEKEKSLIYLGGDHAGYFLKENVKLFLIERGFSISDFGPEIFDQHDDYPDILHPLACELSKYPKQRAIVFGGSGMGESIVLNRYSHVRCGVWYGGDFEIIKNYREHDDINALAIATRFIETKDVYKAIEIFLQTRFLNEERFIRRVEKIDGMKIL